MRSGGLFTRQSPSVRQLPQDHRSDNGVRLPYIGSQRWMDGRARGCMQRAWVQYECAVHMWGWGSKVWGWNHVGDGVVARVVKVCAQHADALPRQRIKQLADCACSLVR